MVSIVHGNIWDSLSNIIAIPVNSEGVMGSGMALEAKLRIGDELFERYKAYCGNALRLKMDLAGSIKFVSGDSVQWLFAFTKQEWRNPSKIEWIRCICKQIVKGYQNGLFDEMDSLALPALGCGKGNWNGARLGM